MRHRDETVRYWGLGFLALAMAAAVILVMRYAAHGPTFVWWVVAIVAAAFALRIHRLTRR